MTWLWIVLTAALAVLAFAAGSRLLDRVLAVQTKPDEVHFVVTEDGWRIALHRYRPGTGASRPRPVILCHGLAGNRFTFDFPGFSLAGYLAERGFDCWVIDLRGAGWSSRHGPAGNGARDWNLDDFVRHDIPAAIAHITGATGADAVSWVGHSLGGTIIRPYMAENPGRVRSAVLLSSPSFAHLDEGLLWRAVRDLGFLARLVSVVPVSTANRILSPLLYVAGVPLKRAVGWPEWENVENMTSERIGRVYHVGSSDVSRGMVFHAARCIRAHRFVSADGATDYSALSGRVREPVLVIRGEADRIVPQGDVEWGFEQVGSPTKRMVTVGKSSGGRADYGHVDLLFGDRAPEEVYPLIAGWIEDHAESGPAE